jgi:hypothetical protein
VLELHDGELRARCLCIAGDGFGRVALLLLVPSGRALTLAATLALTTWVKAPVTSGCSRQTMLESRHSFARYLGDPHTPPAVAGLQAPVDLAGAAVEVEHVQHLRRPVRGGHRADHVVVDLVEPDAR